MIALLCRNLTCYISKDISSSVCRSRFSFSLSLQFFSTSRGRQTVTSPTVHDFLLYKHKFSPEVVSRVESKLTRLKNPEKADSVLSFLKESGFSTSQLEKIVKSTPKLLSARLEVSVKPKIKIFQDLGLSSYDISTLIAGNPKILQSSAINNIIPSLSLLKGLFGANLDVAKVLRRSAWFITANLEKTVVPNVEFLKNFGIPMERIVALLHHYPRGLLRKPEIMVRAIEKAGEMGVNRSSKVFIYAIRIIISRSNEALEIYLEAFRNLGFSDSDVLTMFRKSPLLFGTSMEKVKKVKEVLLATGKFSMSCIVRNPMSLSCSIEKRYEPRLRILGILESRNLIKKWPGLGKLYTLTDDKFFEKFIRPYFNEVGDVYMTKRSIRASGTRGKRKMKH